jgi:hypothetical protein
LYNVLTIKNKTTKIQKNNNFLVIFCKLSFFLTLLFQMRCKLSSKWFLTSNYNLAHKFGTEMYISDFLVFCIFPGKYIFFYQRYPSLHTQFRLQLIPRTISCQRWSASNYIHFPQNVHIDTCNWCRMNNRIPIKFLCKSYLKSYRARRNSQL